LGANSGGWGRRGCVSLFRRNLWQEIKGRCFGTVDKKAGLSGREEEE